MSEPIQTRKPGRPRDPSADRAILEAALKLLTDQGYAGMSVEQIAAEAKVGKTTIYRRYASKEELVIAALGALRDDLGPLPDTGDTRTDLVELIEQTQIAVERGPGFAMIGALLVEEGRNPELLALFRERFLRPRLRDALTVLERGVSRGDIRGDVALRTALHVMMGSIVVRHILGNPQTRKQAEETVDSMWNGLANQPEDQ